MIRLVLVIPTLDRSGAEKQLALLATNLPRDEFDVHVVALTRGGPYEELLKQHEIPLTILNKRLKFDPIAFWKLRKLLKKLKPVVVHPWLFAANSYTRLLTGKRTTPKVVVSERCVDSWKQGWQLWLDRRQISRTHHLVGNSQSVVDFYQQVGYPAEKISVIPNAVELPATSMHEVPNERRAKVLSEFNIPTDAKVVGFVGRLARQKRVADLMWAMQLLRQLTENVYFLLVGDGPEREKLEELAAHYGYTERVRFLGHRSDATELMQLMNVFWLASDFEGLSNSLMEAMAAGVPAVVSDIPPNRELVIDGETGFVVNVGDSVGFAQFADRIMNDVELSEKLAKAARDRMEREFSLKKMVQSHVELYRRLCNEK